MQVISTNIAKPRTIIWNGKEVTTGIYKTQTKVPIFLGKQNVIGDEVSDRRIHGGEFKACYLFSEEQYPFWKNLYPDLDWSYGMFGENLTIKGMDETKIFIGDIYKIGNAIVQISVPREPCFKFAYKFNSELVLQEFITHGYPGTYVRVLQDGYVKANDTFELFQKAKDSISVFELFKSLYNKTKNTEHISVALLNEALSEKIKKRLRVFLNN